MNRAPRMVRLFVLSALALLLWTAELQAFTNVKITIRKDGSPVIEPNPVVLAGKSNPAGPGGVEWRVTRFPGDHQFVVYTITFESGTPFEFSDYKGVEDTNIDSGNVVVDDGTYPYKVRVEGDSTVIAEGEVIVDSSPPVCTSSKLDFTDSLLPSLTITVTDNGSGIQNPMLVTSCNNAEFFVDKVPAGVCPDVLDTFENGAHRVEIKIKKAYVGQGGTNGTIVVKDLLGNSVVCDPVMARVFGERGKPVWETFSRISRKESFVTLYNGDPGLQRMLVIVNGFRFRALHLYSGEERTLDVSSAMLPGNTNIITVQAPGRPGGSATILIWDGRR
jgi:hypothetical protein